MTWQKESVDPAQRTAKAMEVSSCQQSKMYCIISSIYSTDLDSITCINTLITTP